MEIGAPNKHQELLNSPARAGIWELNNPSKTGITSGQAYEFLKDHPDSKSRASVIIFLNEMVEEGVLEYEEKTGKGGHHRVYYPKMTKEQFWARQEDSDSLVTARHWLFRAYPTWRRGLLVPPSHHRQRGTLSDLSPYPSTPPSKPHRPPIAKTI